MTDLSLAPARYSPAIELSPSRYVPAHDLPHPANDPAGHLHALRSAAPESPISAATLAALPTDRTGRPRAVADLLAAQPQWRHAMDLFNGGFYWEAHEAWEGSGRARDLLGDRRDAKPGGRASCIADTLGLSRESIARLLDELELHLPECRHTSKCPVVRGLVRRLRMST